MNALVAARWYVSHFHFLVLPVPFQAKGPLLKDWQKLRLDEGSPLENYFNGEPMNIGILLGTPAQGEGEPGGFLCDVDHDCPESRWAWMELGVETGMIFGRLSNPASHHFFYSEPAAGTHKYSDPLAKNPEESTILELRSRTAKDEIGFQGLVPPSTHPSGEPYEFVIGHSHAPALVAKLLLERAVRHTAAAVLLGRHAKAPYHDLFLALAGTLARAQWPLEEAQRLLRALYRVIWTEEAKLNQADADAESSFKRYAESGDVTGLARLRQLLEPPVFQRITQWLALREETKPVPPPPKRLPRLAAPLEELRAKEVRMPNALIQDFITIPGLTLVVSPHKAGKTVLSVQMGMSIANGQHLFQNYQTGQSGVLILEFDDPQGEASLKDFLLKARASRPDMPFDFILPGEDSLALSDPEFLPFLKSEIQRLKAGFTVLDSYTALRGIRSGGTDIVKLESDELMQLSRLARDLECAILLIHHDSKSSAHLDWAERAAGSYAVGAAADSLIRLSRFPGAPEDDGARLVSVRGRHLRGTELVVRFCETSLDFDLVLAGAAARDYPELRQLHQQFRGISFSAKDVGKELGWSRSVIYRLLARLVSSRVLRKEPSAWRWDPAFNGNDL